MNHLTFGLFLGKIEEGARIFTPVRLLPYDHPEALGHDFPTVQAFHESEYQTLLLLGERIGLKLAATLERYPKQPTSHWAYTGFSPPPVDSLRRADTLILPPADSPIPGLRAVAFYHRFPIAFIIDTRSLTLAERGMDRPTTSGLDISRRRLLDGLTLIGRRVQQKGAVIILFMR